MRKKSATLVGTARDAIMALYVTRNEVRQYDLGIPERRRSDVEHIGLEIHEEVKEGGPNSGAA